MTDREEFQKDDGGVVRLCALHQAFFLAHLYEGVLTEEIARRRFENMVASLATFEGTFEHPHLLAPEGKPFGEGRGAGYSLPNIVCVGRFELVSEDPRSLVVGWMQNDLAVPIDPSVLSRIQALDWKTLSRPIVLPK